MHVNTLMMTGLKPIDKLTGLLKIMKGKSAMSNNIRINKFLKNGEKRMRITKKLSE